MKQMTENKESLYLNGTGKFQHQMKIRTSKIYQALLARLLEEQNHLEM
jgi:hypothetical protein